jgi:two-component system cell cycle sensor histidine kinase/response regulator CckA
MLRAFPLKTSRIVVAGFVLASANLALLAFQRTLPTDFLTSLADFGLALLVSAAAWRASRRSSAFARVLWLCLGLAFAFQTIHFGIATVIELYSTLQDALRAFWPTTIIFYMVSLLFALPALLREEPEAPGVDWFQTLDIVQIAILTLSAYLVFVYVPILGPASEGLRTRYFMILHLTRGGFLGLVYLYRGWQSHTQDLRRLQFQLAAFFAVFGATASFYFYATNTWRWPQPLISFTVDLPVVYLLIIAAAWRQERELASPDKGGGRRKGMIWAQVFPVTMPLAVIAVATRVTSQYVRMAWIAVAASFICSASRLILLHRVQERTSTRLSAAEERFFRAFRSSPIAIAISRLSDGTFVDANDHWLELMKLSREQVIARTSVELGVFKRAEERNKLVDAIKKQGSFRAMPFNFQIQDRTLETLVSAEVVTIDGELMVLSSILDMTELRDVRQQLQQAQKMEVVGRLAGGVAHDFNNLLTIIKGYSELVQMRGLEGEMAKEVRQIREAADKAAALTRQLLAFSRRQILQPRNIGLNTVVAEIGTMLRRTIGANIDLVTSFVPDLGTVHADPAQMEQVVMNLAINACDAMPDGGRLLFATKNLDITVPYPGRGFDLPPGRYVMLSVTDSGTGIQPTYLDKIFEPFFTTKEVGKGTGLGLSTVYGIIKQSGGYIWVESKVGLGTTFNICLPRVDRPVDAIQQLRKPPENLRGTETLLVVENDPRVCELSANVLISHGYKVLTARSAEEAQTRADGFQGVIHLLLTDIVLARISGEELARRLRAKRPGLKVLYTSGYPHYSLAENVVDFREAFLAKPFSSSDLARAVRKHLSHADSPLVAT